MQQRRRTSDGRISARPQAHGHRVSTAECTEMDSGTTEIDILTMNYFLI